jgi:hypothetical protein
MTWQKWLASNRVHHHKTTPQEITGLRKLIERDLHDASIPQLSSDRRFATAYNAILQLSKMTIACSGYRFSSSSPGHHKTTFEAVRLAFGPSGDKYADYFETCRRMRNIIDYDYTEVASEIQAEELLKKAFEYRKFVEEWISAKHPNYTEK